MKDTHTPANRKPRVYRRLDDALADVARLPRDQNVILHRLHDDVGCSDHHCICPHGPSYSIEVMTVDSVERALRANEAWRKAGAS